MSYFYSNLNNWRMLLVWKGKLKVKIWLVEGLPLTPEGNIYNPKLTWLTSLVP